MVNGELEPEASFAIQKILFILFILSKTKRLRWWFCRRANTESFTKRRAKWGWTPQGAAPGIHAVAGFYLFIICENLRDLRLKKLPNKKGTLACALRCVFVI